MPGASDRILYIGTADGLYEAEEEDGVFDARPIGFQHQGVMRAPVVVDRDDSRRLYAGTTKTGLFVSEDRGASWREANQGIVYKEIWSIAQHPLTRTLWVGTCPADVYRSDDHGESWQECEQLLTLPSTREWTGPVAPHVARMKWLGLDPTDANIIFGAIEEGWAVRSLDGGQTWEQLAQGTDHDSHTIEVMPDHPETVLASGGKGMFRSTDRGATWTTCNQGIESFRYTPAHVVVRAARPRELLTTITATGPGGWQRPEGPGVAFARSDDQGQTWYVLPEAVPEDFRPVPRALVGDPEDLDACFAGMTDGSVWMSTDDGEHFARIIAGLPPVHSLAVAHR